ncbi:MAG: HAD-IA family hydrolase [Lachnospiraceae bacterium]|nr:HAD-IA family hydrolase [Lachnospiraceae bacterium]
MYRYLLIDFDNTLMDFTKTEHLALIKAVKDCCGRDIGAAETALYHRINDSYWKRLERREVTREQLKFGRFSDFTQAIGITDTDVNVLNKYYMDCLSGTSVEYPDSFAACRELAERYDLYIITNGTTYIQKARLEGTTFKNYIKKMFISDEIGADKPAPAFFEPVVKEIGDTDLRHYLVVGDSVSSDILFGRKVGIDTCFVGQEGSGADYTIAGIGELPELLRRIEGKM